MPTVSTPIKSNASDPLWFFMDLEEDRTLRPSQVVERQYAREVSLWLAERQHGLVITIHRLTDLLIDPDTDAADRPDLNIVTVTADLLQRAYADMQMPYFPRGWVVPIPNRGIRIEWAKGNKHVRLSLSPTATATYLYHEEGQFQTESPSAERLSTLLRWLEGA